MKRLFLLSFLLLNLQLMFGQNQVDAVLLKQIQRKYINGATCPTFYDNYDNSEFLNSNCKIKRLKRINPAWSTNYDQNYYYENDTLVLIEYSRDNYHSEKQYSYFLVYIKNSTAVVFNFKRNRSHFGNKKGYSVVESIDLNKNDSLKREYMIKFEEMKMVDTRFIQIHKSKKIPFVYCLNENDIIYLKERNDNQLIFRAQKSYDNNLPILKKDKEITLYIWSNENLFNVGLKVYVNKIFFSKNSNEINSSKYKVISDINRISDQLFSIVLDNFDEGEYELDFTRYGIPPIGLLQDCGEYCPTFLFEIK